MKLSDLFVSHKQVNPVDFEIYEDDVVDNIYLNLDRAKSALAASKDVRPPYEVEPLSEPISSPIPTTPSLAFDMSTWRVGRSSTHDVSSEWKVRMGMPQINEEIYTNDGGNPSASLGDSERARYWANIYSGFGLNEAQQVAIISAMKTECSLNPFGAVNRKELEGKGNTKPGWAHAGEGTIGITHWKTKKELIDRFNADPRRKGPKLSNVESEYAKADSRHIADLGDEDQALITILFYQPLLDRMKGNTSFNDTIAEFYLSKAGRGFASGATPYDHAVATGEYYRKSHADLGYKTAAQTNQFLKSLDYATGIARELGYSV